MKAKQAQAKAEAEAKAAREEARRAAEFVQKKEESVTQLLAAANMMSEQVCDLPRSPQISSDLLRSPLLDLR